VDGRPLIFRRIECRLSVTAGTDDSRVEGCAEPVRQMVYPPANLLAYSLVPDNPFPVRGMRGGCWLFRACLGWASKGACARPF